MLFLCEKNFRIKTLEFIRICFVYRWLYIITVRWGVHYTNCFRKTRIDIRGIWECAGEELGAAASVTTSRILAFALWKFMCNHDYCAHGIFLQIRLTSMDWELDMKSTLQRSQNSSLKCIGNSYVSDWSASKYLRNSSRYFRLFYKKSSLKLQFPVQHQAP